MKDYQRGWYFQLLIESCASPRPGYLRLDSNLWSIAGAKRRDFWESHKAAVLACFKVREMEGQSWLYNERMLHTIEHCSAALSNSLERKRGRAESISKSMKGNNNASKQIKTDPSISNTKHFSKPSLEEVILYCIERKNSVDAESFINHYEANGWKVGRTAMKDWRAAVRTWEKNDYGTNRKPVLEDLSGEANPECQTCKGEGYRASYSTPGKREPCECTRPLAAWRDRSNGSGAQMGDDGIEEAWFEEPEEIPARAMGAAVNGAGKGAV